MGTGLLITLFLQTAQPAQPVAERVVDSCGRRARQPRVARAQDGRLALAFVSARREIRVLVHEAGQGEWGEPRLVRDAPNLALGARRGPRVAFSGGDLVVSWIDARYDVKARVTRGSGNLFVTRSSDGGRRWSEPVVVNREGASASEGLHDLAAGPDGRVALCWLDLRGPARGTKLWFARSDDGGRSFGEERALYLSPSGSVCQCCHPSLAFDAAGRIVVMWRNSVGGTRDPWVGRLLDGGDGETGVDTRLRAEPVSRLRWELRACPMDGGGLALGRDGEPRAVWRKEGTLFWTPRVGEAVELGRGENASLARSGERYLAVWHRRGRIFARFLAEGGGGPGADVPLGDGAWPVAAGLPGGRFLVVAERRAGRGSVVVSWELGA